MGCTVCGNGEDLVLLCGDCMQKLLGLDGEQRDQAIIVALGEGRIDLAVNLCRWWGQEIESYESRAQAYADRRSDERAGSDGLPGRIGHEPWHPAKERTASLCGVESGASLQFA